MITKATSGLIDNKTTFTIVFLREVLTNIAIFVLHILRSIENLTKLFIWLGNDSYGQIILFQNFLLNRWSLMNGLEKKILFFGLSFAFFFLLKNFAKLTFFKPLLLERNKFHIWIGAFISYFSDRVITKLERDIESKLYFTCFESQVSGFKVISEWQLLVYHVCLTGTLKLMTASWCWSPSKRRCCSFGCSLFSLYHWSWWNKKNGRTYARRFPAFAFNRKHAYLSSYRLIF